MATNAAGRVRSIKRRTFLVGLGSLAVSDVTGRELGGHTGSAEGTIGEPLRELPEVRSSGGVLEHTLRVAAQRVRVGDVTAHIDTYNGVMPGDALRIRPGDRVRLRLHNTMVPMGVPTNGEPPSMCHTPSLDHPGAGQDEHCEPLTDVMTSTNLHTHGLQVSPSGASDNVFIRVPAGQAHQYEYEIPANHPAGLHWYHPHFHGSTTHQAWQGLAGPIIVEGDIDEVPSIADARDRTMVINGLWLDDNGEVPTALVLPTAGDNPFTSLPAVPTTLTFTVNGQLRPEIDIQPGEIQRWRILNAEPHRAIWLHIEGHALHQIGQDGIPFSRPRAVQSIMLSSGNRAEFLVRAYRPGRYRVYAENYDQGHPGGARPTVELATMVVSGRRVAARMPVRLVDPPRMPSGPVARTRTLRFSGDISGRAGPGVRFLIDDQEFDPDRIDQTVTAGTIEEWTLVNDDVFQHPIHIHVNPFQVIDVQGIPAGDPSWQTDPHIWWDTYRLPPNGQVTIRTYFRPDITGKTVYHCHILPHEDNGMMGTLLIQPARQAAEQQ